MRIPLCILSLTCCLIAEELPVMSGLLLDLDAGKGLILEEEDKVSQWKNQAASSAELSFVKQDKGRKQPGSGRPMLRTDIGELNGHSSLVFRQGELVCHDEESFDSLSTGSGHTWLAVLCVHRQRVGLKDVNAFFGNLRNEGKYEGIWAGLRDDNTLWTSPRNGLTFGRFDKNNPLLLGPLLEEKRFYVIAGRMQAGSGKVQTELFLNGTKPIATAIFPVSENANPSKMVIGQERDAINHPGFESFDGEIARLLIYQRPLGEEELAKTMTHMVTTYSIRVDAE